MRDKITKRTVDALKAGARDEYLWDPSLPGFGVKVTPKGRKVFVVQYRMGGRGFPTRRHTIGVYGALTPEQARSRAVAVLRAVHDGRDPQAEKASARIDTVKLLVSQFCQSRRDKGRRSADGVETLLTRLVVTPWGDRPMAGITRHDVVKLLDGIVARGCCSTANRLLAHLKTMFTWAEGRGAIKNSPCKGVEKPATAVSRDRVPDDAELVEIWRAAEALGGWFGGAYKLLILTGQRREEVGRMTWAEVNLEKAVWTLPASRSKNGLAHYIHLSATAVALLRTMPRTGDAAPVFSVRGVKPISGWSGGKRALDQKIALRRAEGGIRASMPAWRTHDLRRAFATGCANLGVAPHVADRILNHVSKSKGGVMATYQRAEYTAERKAAMTLWAEHIERLLNGNTGKVLSMKREAK